MYDKNLLIGLILAFISLAGFTLAVWQGMHWIRESVLDKLRRALFSGLGFAMFIIGGTVALDYLGSPDVEKNWNKEALGNLICLAFPMIALTTIGAFVWFLRRESTQKFLSDRLDRIIEKSKKPK